jgi:type III secretion inner rod protein HrpB2
MIDALSSPPAAAVHAFMTTSKTQGPEIQGLSDRFNRLMAQQPDPAAYSEHHLAGGVSPASAFVSAQERVMYSTFDEVRRFSVEAPGMSLQDVASRHIDLTYQVAMVSMQFNAGVYMAQSSKSGLQTLMRNQ